MSFLFRNESFAFETLRAAGAAAYGSADLGEILATARAIPDGDEVAWLSSWRSTAQRVHAIADTSLAAGQRASARDAYLRASSYYRTAEFFRRADPASDANVRDLSRASRSTFVRAIGLMDRPVEEVRIPYEETTLPGYLFLVDDSGRPRPTVIYTNGYDSTAEESWAVIASPALARGYNVLAYDGPGQGAVIREQGLVFRHDWERVLSPVVDFAVARHEVDARSIVHFGYSMGAYLVARAAAFDTRPAALLLNDGIYDFHQAYRNAIPGFVMKRILRHQDGLANFLLARRAAHSTQVRWGLNNGRWVIGGRSHADFIRRTQAYSLASVVKQIEAPTLIMDAEEDQFLEGQPEILARAMTARTTLTKLTTAEGAGEHCHVGSLARAHQVMFDWLGATLAPPVTPAE